MKKLIFTLLFLISQQITSAQDERYEKLDQYFNVLQDNNKFMGGLSIFKGDQEVYSKSVGFSDRSQKILPDKRTKYAIGSISKTFTAVMIFQAIEEGELSLNQTLNTFFAEIPNAEKITIAHMLQHRSGIYNYTDATFSAWSSEPQTREGMVARIKAGEVAFEPNAAFGYSNANYLLLSYILEDIYNKSFDELFKDQIIHPLNLHNTSFEKKIDNNYAKSYTYLDKWRVDDLTDRSITIGAAGIYSTPYDINIFAHALFSEELINKESLQKMMTTKDNVGMGLFKIPFYTMWGLGHSGGIDGFHSFFVYFPTHDISYSIVSNGLNYIFNDIHIAVLSDVFDQPYTIPNFTEITLKAEDLDNYLGLYSSDQLPIKLNITKKESALIAQGTGQSPFNLTPIKEHIFEFKQAGIIIEFKPTEKSLILKQGGGTFLMKR